MANPSYRPESPPFPPHFSPIFAVTGRNAPCNQLAVGGADAPEISNGSGVNRWVGWKPTDVCLICWSVVIDKIKRLLIKKQRYLFTDLSRNQWQFLSQSLLAHKSLIGYILRLGKFVC